MEEKELIYKRPDPNDGRSVRIFLSEEGKRKQQVAKETVKAFNKAVKEKVSPSRLETFFSSN